MNIKMVIKVGNQVVVVVGLEKDRLLEAIGRVEMAPMVKSSIPTPIALIQLNTMLSAAARIAQVAQVLQLVFQIRKVGLLINYAVV
jgi:hypothetical protein